MLGNFLLLVKFNSLSKVNILKNVSFLNENSPIDIFYYGLQYRKALNKKRRSEKHTKSSCEENEANRTKKIKKIQLLKEAKKKEANQRIFFQLVESFTENAPQLLLQLYILAKKLSTSFSINRKSKSINFVLNTHCDARMRKLIVHFLVSLQTVSIFSSLFRLAFNLTIFQKITWTRSWILFPAHFFVIGNLNK